MALRLRPKQRAEHVAAKIDREPDEIVRMVQAVRNADLFFQSQREISAGSVENLLKLDRPVAERFYALYREHFNPDLTVPKSMVMLLNRVNATLSLLIRPSVGLGG